jgi:hypothetical protein
MMESICAQGFTYVREVEEDWAKYLVKLGQRKATEKTKMAAAIDQNRIRSSCPS